MPSRLARLAAAAGAAARAAVPQWRHSGGGQDATGGSPGAPPSGASRSAVRASGALPTPEWVRGILTGFGLHPDFDDDGDLALRWDGSSIYFFHYGVQREVLQARLYLNRRFEVEMRPTLALLLDDWNRSKLFPKAYTVLPDDGLVGVCAEQAFDFEGGTSEEQLRFTLGTWLRNLHQFTEWIEEHV